MFGKIFASLWQGSMVGQADAQLVFVYMIANCDVVGNLDQTQEVIAALTGLPIERVEAAIGFLESPDVRSRSRSEDGRRIVPVDADRGWGWRIVNYGAYRAMRDEETRRVMNAERMRRTRARPCDPVRHGVPSCAQAEAEAEGEGEGVKGSSPERREDGVPGRLRLDLEGSSGLEAEIGTGVRSSSGEIGAGRGAGRVRAGGLAGVEAIVLAGGREWRPKEVEVEEWRRLFPGVDVVKEFRKMRAWTGANVKRRKTAQGVRAFVASWLTKEQDSGAGRGREEGGQSDRMKSREARAYFEANRKG